MLGLTFRVPGAAATSGSIAEEVSTLVATAGSAVVEALGKAVDGIWGLEDWGCCPDGCLSNASAGRSVVVSGMLGEAAEPEFACTACEVILEGG